MPNEFEKTKLEYQNLIDSTKFLFDSFYKLATMTFAWNASLGAAIGFIYSNDTKFHWYGVAALIAAFAMFYNAAALVAYRSALSGAKEMMRKLGKLVAEQNGFDITKELTAPKKLKNGLVGAMVSGVLIFMIGLWLYVFLWFAT